MDSTTDLHNYEKNDVIYQCTESILRVYNALKNDFGIAQQKIKLLEKENLEMKLDNSNNLVDFKTPPQNIKRRKTTSTKKKGDEKENLNSHHNNSAMTTLSPNNSIIIESDEFNNCIQNVSSFAVDEDVIAATPQLNTPKKDLNKSKILNFSDYTKRQSLQQTKSSLSLSDTASFTELNDPLPDTNLQMKSKVNEPKKSTSCKWISKVNSSSINSEIKIRDAFCDTNNVPLCQPTEAPANKENISKVSSEKSPKNIVRRYLSLNKNMKQTTLNFYKEIVDQKFETPTNKDGQNDYDSTFCEGIAAPFANTNNEVATKRSSTLLRQKCLESFQRSSEKFDKKDIFKFSPIKQKFGVDNEQLNHIIKMEPKTLNAKESSNTTTNNNNFLPKFKVENIKLSDSSVFAVENKTDDVVLIEETLSLCNATSEFEIDKLIKPMDSKLIVGIRDNHKVQNLSQHSDGEPTTKAGPEKLPGFVCPDCAPYFRYIGAGMTDKQIQDRINACSRHKQNINLPDTPDGFWIPYFIPTQKDYREETICDYRRMNRNDLIRASQKK